MSELWKIGVVYEEQPPQVFADPASEDVPWQLEYIHEAAVQEKSVSACSDYLAVFLPAGFKLSDGGGRFEDLFPGTELIGYESDAGGNTGFLVRREDGRVTIRLPMQIALARHLLESCALLKSQRCNLSQVRRDADRIQQLFDSFVDTVEASCSIKDRKLGMNLLVNRVLEYLEAEECLLYVFGEGGTTLKRAHTTGNIGDLDLFDYHGNGSIVEKVVSTGMPYLNNDYSFEIKVPFGKSSVFTRSILCVPLQRRGRRIGAVEVLNKKNGGFTAEDRLLLQKLVEPVAVAAHAIRMFENAERLTITDDLTKLYNYRYLMEYLESEVRRCLRYKKNVSLLFIDVDGFKRINDTFGHLVGSQALAEMGQVFRRILRETDVVGRYGGDEFLIVLPETPLNGAMVIAERIRKKVEDYEFISQNLSIRLTVSLGIANCPKHTLTAEGLIKKADAAMYRAKELSKNSIKVAL